MQHSGFWHRDIWWYYEIGISLVGVMACQAPSLKPVARPGLSFAFFTTRAPNAYTQSDLEWEIKRQIKQRWPKLADLRQRT